MMRPLEELFFNEAVVSVRIRSATFAIPSDNQLFYCSSYVDEGLFSEQIKSDINPCVNQRTEWELNFRSIITHLGTNDSPLCLVVAVYRNNRILDDFIGKAVIILAEHADTQVHRLHLPLIDSQGEQAGTINVFLRVNVDIKMLLTVEEIEQCYETLLKHNPETEIVYALESKWQILEGLVQISQSKIEAYNQKYQPNEFLVLLQNREMQNFHWRVLQTNLLDIRWKNQFVEQFGGLKYLFFSLEYTLLDISRINQRSDACHQTLSLIMITLHQMHHYPSSQIKEDDCRVMLLTFEHLNITEQLVCLTVFKRMSCASPNAALSALTQFMFVYKKQVGNLVEEIFHGNHLLLKISWLDILFQTVDLALDKDQLLQLYAATGFSPSALQKLGADFPDPDLLDKIDDLLSFEPPQPTIQSPEIVQEAPTQTNGETNPQPEETQQESEESRLINTLKAELAAMKEKNRKLEAESTILKQQLARPASSPNSAIFKTPLKPKKAEEDTKAAAQPTLVPPQRFATLLEILLQNREVKAKPPPASTRGGPPPPPTNGQGPIPGVRGGAAPPPPRPAGTGAAGGKSQLQRSNTLVLRVKKISAMQSKQTIFEDLKTIEKKSLDTSGISNAFSLIDQPRKVVEIQSTTSPEMGLCTDKRRQQIAIFLKHSPITGASINKYIQSLSLDQQMSIDELELFTALFSTKNSQEMEAFRDLKTDIESLPEVERLLYDVYQIPNFVSKLEILLFKMQFPSIFKDAKHNAVKSLTLLDSLKSKKFQLFLSYVIDVANILQPDSSVIYGFQLCSLHKLRDLKSPSNPSMSLLHYLAGLFYDQAPDLLTIASSVHLAAEAHVALANFQCFFPSIIKKIYNAELQLSESKKEELTEAFDNSLFGSRVEEFLESLIDSVRLLSTYLQEIDSVVVFLGDFKSDSENATTADLKKQWLECHKLNILTQPVCETRSKRDEDLYMFFSSIHQFLAEFKQANAFVVAKREKEQQQNDYNRAILGPLAAAALDAPTTAVPATPTAAVSTTTAKPQTPVARGTPGTPAKYTTPASPVPNLLPILLSATPSQLSSRTPAAKKSQFAIKTAGRKYSHPPKLELEKAPF